MRVVMIVPTGIGCSIGGHAGDANPAAKLLATVCDELIVHPNVVNASDINEMSENTLYVEGSALDRFLRNEIALRRVHSGQNRILVLANRPAPIATRNAVGAARATIGADVKIVELETPLKMRVQMLESGAASGRHAGVYALINQVRNLDDPYDVLAISTPISVDVDVAWQYLREGGVNPWGGIEALVSRRVSAALNVPVAHAPIGGMIDETFDEVVHDRRAAECVSHAYLHCVLKGLHRAPRLVGPGEAQTDLTVREVDMLVSPRLCWGSPHRACIEAGVEVVWVLENTPEVRVEVDSGVKPTVVTTYLEAAGLIAARRAGVSIASVSMSRIGTTGSRLRTRTTT